MWITCCIFHACQLNSINCLWSEGKYTYKSTDLMYIKFLSQWTVITNAVHHLNQNCVWVCVCVLIWWAQILTLWETSCFDMSISAFGLKLVNVMPTDSPNWDSSFINWEYVTFEVQLECMLRRWIFLNSQFHYSTPIYFWVCRQVKFNR